MKKAILVLLALLFAAHDANACSCMRSSFEEDFERAATVLSVQVIKHLDDNQVLFKVLDTWKGVAPSEKIGIIGWGLSSACTPTKYIQPDIGAKFIVYHGELYSELPLRIQVKSCSRTAEYESAPDDAVKLKKYSQDLSKLSGIEKVRFLLEHKDFAKAEAVLSKVIQDEPENETAHVELAQIQYRRADVISTFARGAELEARTKLQTRLYKEALANAEKALALNPQSKQARSVKAAIMLDIDREFDDNISGLDLSDTELKNQSFIDQTIDSTNFQSDRFNSIEFVDTIITNSKFTDARFLHSRIHGSTISNSNFDGVEFNEGSRGFNGASRAKQTSEIAIENSGLENSSFKNAFIRIPIKGTTITNSDFEGARIWSGRGSETPVFMDKVSIQDSNFERVEINNQNFFALGVIKDSVFANTNFKRASISARFVNTDLSTANLEGAYLLGSAFDCETKWPENFNPIEHDATPEQYDCGDTKFSYHDFSERHFDAPKLEFLNLEQANFRNSILDNANFRKSNLKDADFTDATVRYADFRNTNLEGAKLVNLNLIRINFGEANLKNADFSGSKLNGWRNFKGAIYNDKTIWPKGFNPKEEGAFSESQADPEFIKLLRDHPRNKQ